MLSRCCNCIFQEEGEGDRRGIQLTKISSIVWCSCIFQDEEEEGGRRGNQLTKIPSMYAATAFEEGRKKKTEGEFDSRKHHQLYGAAAFQEEGEGEFGSQKYHQCTLQLHISGGGRRRQKGDSTHENIINCTVQLHFRRKEKGGEGGLNHKTLYSCTLQLQCKSGTGKRDYNQSFVEAVVECWQRRYS